MKPVATFLLFSMQLSLVLASMQGISRAAFGQNCSKEVRCDSRKFLSCTNGQCDCLMPDTMVYDEVLEQCVTLAGERCQYTTVEAEKSWTDEVPCIPNALCQQGVCNCDNNHYEISNGTCQRKREYGEECFTNQMCDNSKHLLCGGDQTCTCSVDRMLSDAECKILAGNSCLPGDTCVDFSECRQVSENNTHFQKCTCVKSYFQTDSGTCEAKKMLGQYCSNDNQCIEFDFSYSEGFNEIPSFLVCTEGTCKCNSRIAFKDTDDFLQMSQCRKYLHQPCKSGECIQGAACSTTCRCKSETHFETLNQACEQRKAFGQSCNADNQCQSEFRCNEQKRKCDCQSGYALDADTGTCQLAVGQQCRANAWDSDERPCASANAFCHSYNHYDFRCACSDGTKQPSPSDGTCYSMENRTCNGDTLGPLTSNQCLPGLVCRNGGCTCLYNDHQVYQESHDKCLSLVGGPCNSTLDCEDSNAECTFKKNMLQCQCKNGFTQAGRQCDLAYGQPCQQENQNPRCDRYGPLECSIREICECSDFQIYDNKTLACRGLTGAKCKINLGPSGNKSKSFCVDGATCEGFRGFENVFGLCACQPGWNTENDRTCVYAKSAINEIPQADAAFGLD